MKALSIQQPWASLIIEGLKRVENRTWRTDYRGPLIIHASLGIDRAAQAWLSTVGIDCEHPQGLPRGVLLGTVNLIDVVPYPAAGDGLAGLAVDLDPYALTRDPLACGPFCWIVADPRPQADPVPYRGRLSLFEVPEEVVK